ncbi:MAG: CRTAC1 family protein [Chloroflexi bacterium]|nr:MAG: CRTAC1 family protein [Chloroflexota bacterium]
MKRRTGLLVLILLIVLAGCAAPIPIVPVSVEAQALADRGKCSDTFVMHRLDHVTEVASRPVEMFDSNGAGLAVNDLDNDGDLDLVLANLDGPNTILWNKGGLQFEKQTLGSGRTRGVSIVDVDGDGWLDIVFTTRAGAPIFWHNTGERAGSGVRLEQAPLPGVRGYAYAMNWGDLDRDGDLDLVTGSYDAALEKELGDSFRFGAGGGVYVYENRPSGFVPARLTDSSQALALVLFDVNGDGRDDIVVGNDFAVRDQVWLWRTTGWEAGEPFATTTHSTMSFDVGDIDNDGRPELLATDMHPYADDPATQAAWKPVMDMMMHGETADDPQIMENTLQKQDDQGRFLNRAPELGLRASGWTWSTKFGDLNNDGFLDVYAVNGMAANELFGHLPQGLLVEENQAFRNMQGRRFEPAPSWALNATDQGRGMSFADLDGDGDLDIVVNNLLSPAQLFENRLCGGASLEIDLRWPGSRNPFAVGARVRLFSRDQMLTRFVRANSGYLSGEPSRLHFGFPADAQLLKLEITWPDGLVSVVNAPSSGQLYTVTR